MASIMNNAARAIKKNIQILSISFFAIPERGSPVNVVWILSDGENFYDTFFLFAASRLCENLSIS